jgi:hypothetical protein
VDAVGFHAESAGEVWGCDDEFGSGWVGVVIANSFTASIRSV